MEQYVTRIGDVTIQRVIPSGGGPPEPVRVMESEELLRAVKEEPIDEDEEGEGEGEGEGEEEPDDNQCPEENKDEKESESKGEEEEEEGEGEEDEEEEEEERIIIKQEPVEDEEGEETELEHHDEQDEEGNDKEKINEQEMEEEGEDEEDPDNEKGENSKRKATGDEDEDPETAIKKKKVEIDVDLDKKKISNLRRNIREVMDETQLDEATLAAQRQEAERLRRVQDQQRYIRDIQRQIQLNRQNSKTQSRVISLLQGGSTSILKSSAIGSHTTSTSTGPSTVLVKVGSGQQQVLNRKTLEVLRGGKSVCSSTEPVRSGITRVTPGNKPAMVTPSVSIAPVKPVVQGEGQKKVSNDSDVVTISSSSDSEDDCIVISEGEQEEEEEEEDDDPTNSGMHTNDLYNIPDENGRVLINVGKPETEAEIFLAPQIARVIKPHQIGGVRFLFDNVVESIERFNSSTGFGCILAHSMGLGKTLQVVSFCDVFLRETSAKTVMCIMPINTLQNWMAEFNMWLPNDQTTSPLAVHGEVRPRHFGIFVLNDLHKTISSRSKVVDEWSREGGVLLIGYEMYRQLSLKRPGRVRKGKKKQQPDEDVEDEKTKPLLEAMHEALVRPGPDLVICDEGHRIKNSHASISHALKQIRTKRRVVLTGYPLQNNLLEYWCMVDFVRPNYLGTKTEFSNMFERPIQNGQCIDSTPQDIRLMRYRAHVLHSLLEGFVQRRSHSVLRTSLPQKEEYVLLVRMTALQRKLYDTFMNEVVRTKAVPNPLKAFAVCCKIWNHPDILYNFLKKKELDELQDLDLEETAALQQNTTGPNSPRRPLAKEKKGKKEVKKAQVAPIKLEVAPPPQTQTQTPELKQEERKFDFPPNSQQQSPAGGPPGYDYYPPPPYSDMPYQYHRPPGMYYPGYYPDNPGYYHGYEQGGYPGYYGGNFGPIDSFPNSGKSDEFGKEPHNNWNNPYSNIKQEKNSPKADKEFEAPHPKPGYQEFYPVKEEKPDVKEEKQTFLCGFSGGQVAYNYRNYPGGYGNYPYPQNEFSGWNKGFPPFPQNEPPMPGGPPTGPPDMHDRHLSGPGNVGGPPNMFGGSEQEHRRMNASHDRPPTQQPNVTSQSTQHGSVDRNQTNQNNDNHSSTINKDGKQRSHSSQERLIGNQNVHSSQENLQVTHLNAPNSQKDDHHRLAGQEHATPQQGMFGNQRMDGNSDNLQRNQDHLMKGRSMQDIDHKRMHSTQNIPPANQQNLFNLHDSLMRNQPNLFENKSSQDDFRLNDRMAGNQQSSYTSSTNQGMPSTKHAPQQSLSGMQNLGENQQRSHGNPETSPGLSQNPYNNQRNEHGLQGGLDHHMTNIQNLSPQNSQERMPVVHPNFFGNQDNHNFPDASNRALGGSDHFPPNQQNIFGNNRNEHNIPIHQEQHGPHQNMMSSTHVQDNQNQRRISMNHENMHMGSQQNMFVNHRNQHASQEHGQQNLSHNSEKDNHHHRMHNTQERHPNPTMFGNQRNEQCNQDNFGTQNKNENDNQLGNQNSKSSSASQNRFPNQRSNDIPIQGSRDHLQSNQQNINMLPENSHKVQTSHDQINKPHTLYSSHETPQGSHQGHFRGGPNQNPQDGPHRIPGHQHQQNYYGNQFMVEHGVHGGDENMNSPQTSHGNQPNQKRLSTDSATGMQNIYPNQNEHSVQKMIASDSHLDKQQILHSNQERPNQYNMFSSQEIPYNCQEPPQNMGENQPLQESQHGGMINRERLLVPPGGHTNQSIPDSQWMHGNQDHPPNQQPMFDNVPHNRGDNQTNQEKQQFHNNQEFPPHNQQNVFSGQSNQPAIHQRNQDHLHGKSQSSLGNQNIHENQYRMTSSHDAHFQDRHPNAMVGIDSQSAVHSNQEQMQRNSKNFMKRQNSQDQRHDHTPNNQNIHGNQPIQHNVQVGPHSSQEQMTGQHGLLGNMPVGKHGMHGSAGHGLGHPQSHIARDGPQGNIQNYGIQSSPPQKISGNNESHQGNQHVSHANQHTSQNLHRNQHGSMTNQDLNNLQAGNNHQIPGNQHNIYGNQFHLENEQHDLTNLPLQSSQHNKNTHHVQSQQQSNAMAGHNLSLYSSHMPPAQGNKNNSQHLQNTNSSQGQGMYPSPPINQGHGTHHPMAPNHQYQMSSSAVPPMPHSNKDASHSSEGPLNSPQFPGSHHGQYMQNNNQQNVSMNSHSMHSDHHMQNNQQSNIPNMGHPVPSHNQQSVPHTKSQSKHDIRKLQASPIQNNPHSQSINTNQNQTVSQQGTQTGVDNNAQNSGNQHRIQNMLGFPSGQNSQTHNPPFEPNLVMSNKGMSGGHVSQGAHQKHNMQNVLGKDEANRFRANFDDQFHSTDENFQSNYQKPGFFGQDFQYPYPGQFPFQDNQFSEQPGPSGQMLRKEDERKDDENKQKESEMKKLRPVDENVKMSTTSTNTETEDEREKSDKKDEEEKEKKQDKPEVTTPQKGGKEDPGIPYDWATELLKGFVPGDINSSAKMAVFFCILEESISLGDRILVFSQSLFTLNLMEELLQQQLIPGKDDEKWTRNVNYYRLDGSTTAMEREKLINEFNSNANLHLFLVSTRAGSLGINLVGANRVIVFDASWNPCHDTQAVCRVYRYGQKKPCFVYRLVTDNCLEKKIYDRQINKQGMSDRVVDECNPDAHLSIKEVTSLCWDDKEDDSPKDFSNLQDSYIDVVLQRVIQKHSTFLSKEPFAHESLLVDRKEKKLSSAEKRIAKRSYELEKQASTRPAYNGIQNNQGRPKPMASVRPMQAELGQASRPRGWIPASVWQRQGMSAQEMTLPLDVVIPTNAADRASIVLKAGQKVMVLKSPKGIYMQLENGKIIAIRTAFKVGSKKPGEPGKGSADNMSQRRGVRQQLGATRGRPVRPVGPVAPVSRPPPVTVTVTRKRPSVEEQPIRRKEDSQSPINSSPATPMDVSVTPATSMEVTVTPSEKDTPNPFTAAAAASLSAMQVSPTQQQQSPSQITTDKQPSPNLNSPIHQTQTSQSQPLQSPIPLHPQATVSPQPQVSVIPLSKSIGSQPQVTVQPLSQAKTMPLTSPVSPMPAQPPQASVLPQIPVLPQVTIQPHPLIPIQPQSHSSMSSQIPVHPQHSHSQGSLTPQQQTSLQPPQTSVQIHQSQSTLQAHQPHPSVQAHQPQPPMQMHQQTPPMQQHHPQPPSQVHQSQTPMQTHRSQSPVQAHQPQPPMQQQPPAQSHQQQPHYSIQPQSQNQFSLQQSQHHQQPSPFPVQPQSQKQTHFPPQQYSIPQQPQFPMSPQQQSQFIGHSPHHASPQFPIHPQSQFPLQPQHSISQQPYPGQAQGSYPMQAPHLQQPQFGAQPPHQYPLHPQPPFPMQPPPSQFEPPTAVPPSIITDQLS